MFFASISSIDIYIVICFPFAIALELIEHLRTMGETNALLQSNKVWKPAVHSGSHDFVFLDLTLYVISCLFSNNYFPLVLEQRNRSCNSSCIWVNVCRWRWHYPSDISGDPICHLLEKYGCETSSTLALISTLGIRRLAEGIGEIFVIVICICVYFLIPYISWG